MRFALLLFASSALAQPFVSRPEVTAPMERSQFSTRPAPAMAMTPDGAGGFVAAWSAGASPSRIYAWHLNASMKPIAPVAAIPSYFGDAYDASYPDIAPIDGGYALVWLERERSSMVHYAHVILRRLTPSFDPLPAMNLGPVKDSGIVRIAGGENGSVSVLVQGDVFTVDRFGVTTIAFVNSWDPEDAVAGAAPIGMVMSDYLPGIVISICPACGLPRWNLDVQIGRDVYSQQFTTELAGLSIGYGGGIYVVAWIADASRPVSNVQAVRIRASDGRVLDSFDDGGITLGEVRGDARAVRPSIGWDGERFLIAWQSAHDIVGATLTPDGHAQSFPLMATADDERAPVVAGVMPGRFALGYEVSLDDVHRVLAGRYVDFKPFRQRASH